MWLFLIGVKPHCCDECNKTFKHESDLKFHKKYHSGERTFYYFNIYAWKIAVIISFEWRLAALYTQMMSLNHSNVLLKECGFLSALCLSFGTFFGSGGAKKKPKNIPHYNLWMVSRALTKTIWKLTNNCIFSLRWKPEWMQDLQQNVSVSVLCSNSFTNAQ